jgi:FixJ family two-component response regulator
MENRGRKILIVDDNPEFIEMVRRLLEAEGFQTTIAISGQKAIEKVLSESPELVLLDLKLPDTSGEEVLRRIRDLNENISNIVITGYGGEQSAVELMKAGAMDFLSKPIERETLLRAVKDAFKIHDVQIDEKQKKNHSSLERFFPFLAHEIRNPLHAIGGALAIIQRRSNLKDEFLAKSIKIIQEEIHHLNDFVQDCLDFVRPPVKSRFIEVDINEIISVIINIMSHMFEESSEKIKIIVEIDSHLPKIYVNYEEVKQALLNIMKNSLNR